MELASGTWSSKTAGSVAIIARGASANMSVTAYTNNTNLRTLTGDKDAGIVFSPAPTAVSEYTLLALARYGSTASSGAGTCGRILTAANGSSMDWLSGHYGCKNGQAAQGSGPNFLTNTSSGFSANTNLLLSSEQLGVYRANGASRVTNASAAAAAALPGAGDAVGVNLFSGELSSWEVAEVVAYDRRLNTTELEEVEEWASCKYGLTLDRCPGE